MSNLYSWLCCIWVGDIKKIRFLIVNVKLKIIESSIVLSFFIILRH